MFHSYIKMIEGEIPFPQNSTKELDDEIIEDDNKPLSIQVE